MASSQQFRFSIFTHHNILTIIFFFTLWTQAYAVSVLPGTNSDEDTPKRSHRVSVTARMHKEHSVIESLPYEDGDMGWLLAYEFHEGIGFWQAGMEVSNRPGKNPLIDYVLTPQLSLILKDRIYRAGAGVRWNYTISDDPEYDGSWSRPNWQFTLGLAYPIWNRFEVGAYGYYVFQEWSELDKFNADDIEFGLSVSYQFF